MRVDAFLIKCVSWRYNKKVFSITWIKTVFNFQKRKKLFIILVETNRKQSIADSQSWKKSSDGFIYIAPKEENELKKKQKDVFRRCFIYGFIQHPSTADMYFSQASHKQKEKFLSNSWLNNFHHTGVFSEKCHIRTYAQRD